MGPGFLLVCALIFVPFGLIFLLFRDPKKDWKWIVLVLMGFTLFCVMYFQIVTAFGFSGEDARFIRGMGGFTGLVGAVAIVMAMAIRMDVQWRRKKEAGKTPER